MNAQVTSRKRWRTLVGLAVLTSGALFQNCGTYALQVLNAGTATWPGVGPDVDADCFSWDGCNPEFAAAAGAGWQGIVGQ